MRIIESKNCEHAICKCSNDVDLYTQASSYKNLVDDDLLLFWTAEISDFPGEI